MYQRTCVSTFEFIIRGYYFMFLIPHPFPLRVCSRRSTSLELSTAMFQDWVSCLELKNSQTSMLSLLNLMDLSGRGRDRKNTNPKGKVCNVVRTKPNYDCLHEFTCGHLQKFTPAVLVGRCSSFIEEGRVMGPSPETPAAPRNQLFAILP